MDAGTVADVLDTVKTVVFPASAVILMAVYPIAVLFWTIIEGQAVERVRKASAQTSACAKDVSGGASKAKSTLPLRTRVRGLRIGGEAMDKMIPKVQFTGIRHLQALVVIAAGGVTLTGLAGRAFAFASGAAPRQGSPQPSPRLVAAVDDVPPAADPWTFAPRIGAVAGTEMVSGFGVACAAGFVGMALALRYSLSSGNDRSKRSSGRPKSMRRAGSGVLRRCASNSEVLYTRCETSEGAAAATDAAQSVRRYNPPADGGPSLWHSVDLHVKTWLDESTGLFRYVNEIPRGALQKFELQPSLAQNVIREDAKGSRKLQAFGRPVPFNYGCFPQTFRDPEEADDIHGAPGDNDPLDVLDLTNYSAGVGEVVCCCILGMVCLIDEGQADWKVIAVNTKAKDPLADARSVEDAERIAPGRIEEALRWIDDFKQHSSKSGTTLHYEIQEAEKAISLLEKDHAAWKRLCAEADASGYARGHWIRSAQNEGQGHPQALGWMPRLAVPGQMARSPSSLAGVSGPATALPVPTPGRELVMRRQTSEGGESSASGVSATSTHLSTDSDACA